MGDAAPASATFYRPAEVAAMLRCSEWWVKEQARKRRIPFSWIGGSYLFTAEHVAEIVRHFEVRPVEAAEPARSPESLAPRTVVAPDNDEPMRLRARTPRRARNATANASAA